MLKKILKLSSAITLLMSFQVILLLIFTDGLTTKIDGGYFSDGTTTKVPGYALMFGGDGYYSRGFSIANLAYVLIILAIISIIIGMILVIINNEKASQVAGIFNILATILLFCSAAMIFYVPAAYEKMISNKVEPSPFWIIAGIILILFGIFNILPAIFSFIKDKKETKAIEE